MNIWDLAKEKLRENQERTAKLEETLEENVETSAIKRRQQSHVIVCGSPNCGKTSLLLKYLERTDAVKPTIALDYQFARRTRGKLRDISNIWELGGGTKFTNLLRLPITPENIEITSIVLVLDISKPAEMWNTLEKTLSAVKEEVEQAMQTLNKNDPATFDRIQNVTKRRFSTYGDALKVCAPFSIPLLIIGSKFDEYQALEPESQRHVAQFLRFVAYYYGASLMFYTNKNETLIRQAKAMLNHYVFDSASPKGHSVDYTRPVFVLCGADNLQDIGMPPASEGSFTRASQPLQLWKEAFCFHYPQKENNEISDDPGSDPLFKESLVDQHVERKTRDLEMYLKQKKDQQVAEQRAMLKIAAL